MTFGMFLLLSLVTIAIVAILIFHFMFLRSWRWRWVFTGSLAAMVFALASQTIVEEREISIKFAELCKGAGVHIFKTVEVPGFFDATNTGPDQAGEVTSRQAIESYEKRGFRFYERKASYNRGGVSRVEKIDGKWTVSILERPKARYHYLHVGIREEMPVGHKLEKRESIVLDSETGNVLARQLQYNRYPNSVDSLWIRFFGTGMRFCNKPSDASSQPDLLSTVFIPSK